MDNPVYYPTLEPEPRRYRLRLQCEKCHTWHPLLSNSPLDGKWVCGSCLARDVRAVWGSHLNEGQLYPVPDDGDGEYDDPRRNITTVPHV